jgi:Peptidase family M28
MRNLKAPGWTKTAAMAAVLILAAAAAAPAQSRGLKAIRAGDMRKHLEFLAAPEFGGRSVPSPEVDIASLYVALEAERAGLKPLLADGSFLQYFPVEVRSVAPEKSGLRLIAGGRQSVFDFPQAFSPAGRSGGEAGTVSGGPVFLGTLLSDTPVEDWSGLTVPDLSGKFAVVLDSPQTAVPGKSVPGPGPLATARLRFLKERGAWGLVTVIRPEREKDLSLDEAGFDAAASRRVSFPDVETGYGEAAAPTSGPGTATAPALPPFHWVDIRHEAAAAILGVAADEIGAMFAAAASGKGVPARALDGRTLEVAIYYNVRRSRTPNVVAWLEGTDRNLRGEYVVIGSHQDHLAPRDGRVLPGADDNGSGTVGMLALAKAFVAQRPKRSIIFVWHSAEENGLMGAYYFVQHCPVPAEKISANLNLDMISRNDPNMIYLIGSNKLSTGLDAAIRAANARSVRLQLDYAYESPLHPDRFFFRSDQLPYIRYGIPGVWFFCGTTPDYHQATDTVERCDFTKMEKVTKLVYLTAMDIGNRPRLLDLDVNPRITERGAGNMKYDWRNPAP